MTFRTRFAPSPTGPLHLGHAYSAMLAHDMARARGGTFLLRIEDIDQSRSRLAWEAQIFDDLHWLGITWDEPVMRQSERMPVYRAALATLWDNGLAFACTCSRRDILAATSAPQEGQPSVGPDGTIYPGTCRNKTVQSTQPDDAAIRLNINAAVAALRADFPLSFQESLHDVARTVECNPTDLTDDIGDIVLSRKDMGTSYHMSVVLDDAAQNITDVVRGEDLFDATKIHVVLQHLLKLPTPHYHHHPLIRDDTGKRLAKRDDARAIRTYRDDGACPADIRKMVGL